MDYARRVSVFYRKSLIASQIVTKNNTHILINIICYRNLAFFKKIKPLFLVPALKMSKQEK